MSDNHEYSPIPVNESPSLHWLRKRRIYLLNGVGLISLVLVGITIAYVVSSYLTPKIKPEALDPEVELPPSPSKYHSFQNGAVCSDSTICSQVGRDILAKNGSAVDITIATLFCNTLVSSQSMGLGGGFFMTIFDAPTNSSYALIARETAPSAATDSLYQSDPGLTREGGRAAAVPGELRGYWEAYRRFGRLPWLELVNPTIKICEDGYVMTKHQRDSLSYRETIIKKDKTLRSLFVNPRSGEFYPRGTVIYPKQMCETLRIIALEGGDTLYNGTLSIPFLEDLQDAGGIITKEDLANYRAEWVSPIKVRLSGGYTLLSVPPPGSGLLLAFILKILDAFHFTCDDIKSTESTVLTYHRIVEAFKYAFAVRSELGDPNFVDVSELIQNLTSSFYTEHITELINTRSTSSDPRDYGAKVFSNSDHGTAHVSVMDGEGSAVSVTSSINLYFGAGVASPRTGIIYNSVMDDFSFPDFSNFFDLGWAPANRVAAGKRPMSSMSPSVVLKSGKARLAIGASGGTKIPTAVAYVIMRHLWFDEDLKAAIDASRIHHQLLPTEIAYEYGMLKDVKEGLIAMGHNMSRYSQRGSIICALARIDDQIYGNADYRKGGDVYGI